MPILVPVSALDTFGSLPLDPTTFTLCTVFALVLIGVLTRQARRERNLRRELDRHRGIVDAAPDGVMIFDLAGVIRQANPHSAMIFGRPREELEGLDVETLVPSALREGHVESRRDYERSPRVRFMASERPIAGLRPDGTEVPLEISLSPFPADAPREIIGIVRDVTAKRAAETNIRSLNDTLRRQARRLESLNRELEGFNYSVSHDLRTPLRAIGGFAEVLVEDHAGELSTEARDRLLRILRASRRMRSMLQNLLSLSRVTQSELTIREIDLSSIAEDIARQLREDDPEANVAIDVEPGLRTRADARMVTLLLRHLIDNAQRFTADRADARIEVGQTDLDGQPHFFVRDNGRGFDPERTRDAFLPFRQFHEIDEEEGGSGIGLATVARIVYRHGGDVHAETGPGRGTTVYFSLPDDDFALATLRAVSREARESALESRAVDSERGGHD